MLPWITSGWLAGLALGAHHDGGATPFLASAAVLGAVSLALHADQLQARSWRLVLGAFALIFGLSVAPRDAPLCLISGNITGRARVDSAHFGEKEARLRLEVIEARLSDSSAKLPRGLRLHARVPLEHAPPAGTILGIDAEVRPRTTLRNSSPHPRLLPSRGRACWARLSSGDSLEVLQTARATGLIASARSSARRRLMGSLSPGAAAVARALVLGEGRALPYELRKTIAAVGLAHLFAVSGLHVGLVSGLLVSVLRWIVAGWARRFDARRLAAALAVPLALSHAAFAGGSPSAWRAAITAALTWGLIALGRRPSPLHVSAGAALLLSAPDPTMALRPAFLLSIVATAAILSAPPVVGRLRWLRSAAVVSARTLVATAPMVWWWFGGVPLIGWLTNLLVLPFGSWVVIPLAHLAAVSSSIPWPGRLVAMAFERSVEALLTVCQWFEALAFTRRLPPLDATQGIIVLVACAYLLVARSWARRAAALVLGALLWLAAEHALVAREQPRGALRVTFVDVGQGDAALIDLPDGRLLMIDTGQGGRHPASRELRGLLAARRRDHIDWLVLTHGHPDHDGGVPGLLDEVTVGEIWVNGQALTEDRDGRATSTLQRALELGTRARFAPELCETTHDLGGAELEVLWPCPRFDPGLGLNDNSLTVQLRYGRRSFLFPGDLEREAEQRLVARRAIRPVDVLKVAHHGSRTSTTAAFLQSARPELAVVSSGAGNRYGHPDPGVLARLRDAGIEVLRTDLGGGVIVTTDGVALEVRR